METPSNVYVYDVLTKPNAATEASVGAVVLAVLDVRPSYGRFRWTVAVTHEQGLRLNGHPWANSPRCRGQMYRNGENFEYRDQMFDQLLSMSVEALDRVT